MLSASNGKIAPEDSNPSYSNSDDSSVAEVAAAASRLHVSLNNTDTPKKKFGFLHIGEPRRRNRNQETRRPRHLPKEKSM